VELWTYHPSSFPLDAHELRIEPMLGEHWKHEDKGFRYREVAPVLWKLLGTDQVLWCFTQRGGYQRVSEEHDVVEWEIWAPPSRVIAYINSPVWERLVRSNKSDDWNGLFINKVPSHAHHDIHALVAAPLPDGGAICRGPLLPMVTREQMQRAETVRMQSKTDPKLGEDYDFEPNG
jgi:hypothetical protein